MRNAYLEYRRDFSHSVSQRATTTVTHKGVSEFPYAVFRRILASCASYSVVATGSHHVPRSGPGVIISNHPSFLDPWVIATAIERPIHWVSASFVSQLPVVGFFAKLLGAVPLRHTQTLRSRTLIQDVGRLLRDGQVVGIFPEGLDGMRCGQPWREPADFHKTFALAVLKAKIPFLPIVPVALTPLNSPWQITLPAHLVQRLDPFEPAFRSGTLNLVIYRRVACCVGRPTTWDASYPLFDRFVSQNHNGAAIALASALAGRTRAKVKALLLRSHRTGNTRQAIENHLKQTLAPPLA